MDKAFDALVSARPPVLILRQILFAMGFGFLGLLVATPLLAVLPAALRKGYVEDTLERPAPPNRK